jgi:hypothetical protein
MTPTNNPYNTGPRYNRGVLGMLGGQPSNSLLGTLYGAWQQHRQNQQMNQSMNQGMDRNVATQDTTSGNIPSSTASNSDWSGLNDGMSPGTQDQPSAQSMSDTMDLASDSFARGGIATQPTVARIAEGGPEAVVPLSGGPHDKTSGAALTDQPLRVPTTPGGNIRSRYRHPGGPVASVRGKPLSGDLPLKPNVAIR